MGRRDESILDVLAMCPWWVSVLLAAAAFVGLRFVLPLLAPSGPATASNYAVKAVLGGLRAAAPFVAFILLVPAPIAAFRQWRERRLLDRRDGLAGIRRLSWARFETLIAEAYRRQGYTVARPAGNGPDGGVDLILRKEGRTLLVQCKQWKAWTVGVKVVRELYGVMMDRHADGGIVVTSGKFTQEARAFAEGKPIDLIGGEELAALIRRAQDLRLPSPNPSSTKGAPVETPRPPQKRCPRCGQPMVLRAAQRGPQAGQQFWGCSQFPQCRATEPL